MVSVKVTFTLDPETVRRLNLAAKQLSRPKSQVIREAVHEYYDRMGRLSESERIRLLRVLDEMMARPPTRSSREVDRELEGIRQARRSGGRRIVVEK